MRQLTLIRRSVLLCAEPSKAARGPFDVMVHIACAVKPHVWTQHVQGHRICNKRASCCVTRACESAHPPDVPYHAVRERSFMPGGHVWRSCLAVVAVAMAGGEDEWR